jgi:hypothetical protein
MDQTFGNVPQGNSSVAHNEAMSPYLQQVGQRNIGTQTSRGLAKCFQYVYIDLSVARNNVVFPTINGDYLFCDTESNGSALIEFDNTAPTPLNPVLIGAGFVYRGDFASIKLTNSAGATGTFLRLLVGSGASMENAAGGGFYLQRSVSSSNVAGTPVTNAAGASTIVSPTVLVGKGALVKQAQANVRINSNGGVSSATANFAAYAALQITDSSGVLTAINVPLQINGVNQIAAAKPMAVDFQLSVPFKLPNNDGELVTINGYDTVQIIVTLSGVVAGTDQLAMDWLITQ